MNIVRRRGKVGGYAASRRVEMMRKVVRGWLQRMVAAHQDLRLNMRETRT